MTIRESVGRFRPAGAGAALSLLLITAAQAQNRGQSDTNQPSAQMTVSVHEAAPTEQTTVADARIEVTEGALTGQMFSTDGEGRAVLPAISRPFALEVKKAGYDSTRVKVTEALPTGHLDVTLTPEARDISLKRGGLNSCTELPAPPEGLDGLREYARVPVHHDGVITVRSAQLPFFSNPGYVYRQTESGWMKNEVDYVLIRSPIPVRGGFVYLITFGGDREQCGSWSIDLTHPS